MGQGQQAELFLKDKYGTHKCPKCGSIGTIVQMGICCRIVQMKEAEIKAQMTKEIR